jgi:hypothetical protein
MDFLIPGLPICLVKHTCLWQKASRITLKIWIQKKKKIWIQRNLTSLFQSHQTVKANSLCVTGGNGSAIIWHHINIAYSRKTEEKKMQMLCIWCYCLCIVIFNSFFFSWKYVKVIFFIFLIRILIYQNYLKILIWYFFKRNTLLKHIWKCILKTYLRIRLITYFLKF